MSYYMIEFNKGFIWPNDSQEGYLSTYNMIDIALTEIVRLRSWHICHYQTPSGSKKQLKVLMFTLSEEGVHFPFKRL